MDSIVEVLGLRSQNNQEFADETGTYGGGDAVETEDVIRINYRGLLRNAGAQEVYLHYGLDGWDTAVKTIPMQKRDDVFTAEIAANGARVVNFCFKDAAGNWDNNNGENWVVRLQ